MSEAEKTKIEIKSFWGTVLFTSEKETIKEAVVDAVLRGADLRGADLRDADLRDAVLRDADLSGADLRDADLRDADFFNVKFYGRGGNTKIKKSQVDDFFKALGIVVEE